MPQMKLAAEGPNLLVPGRTCWRVAPAGRAALLVDGAAYYSSLKAALLKARRQAILIGWDMDSRVELEHGAPPSRVPNVFGKLLNYLVATRPRLHVHVLEWDFSMFMALEREVLPVFGQAWKWHPHLRFQLDGTHPLSACHHQKIVVIDDALAFCGGMDIGKGRRDWPEHLDDDPRRVDLEGVPYPPRHDVQMMVDGPAAAALGQLARERWRRATGRRLRVPKPGNDPWPAAVRPDFRDVEVGIARTEPEYDGRPAVRENETLWLDAIESARHTIYIENQYLAADQVVAALARRLQEPDGPDIVLVIPLTCLAWIERTVMGAALIRSANILQQADIHKRLRLLTPVTERGAEIQVHAKLLVVDDEFLRVGSTNLNNRSMGLDTECDVAIEARGRPDLRAAIVATRNRLVAEHLDVAPERVASETAKRGRFMLAVDALRRNEGRSLRPLDTTQMPRFGELLPKPLVDPERPLGSEALTRHLPSLPHGFTPRTKAVVALGGLLFLAAALLAVWQLTPLADYLTAERVVSWIEAVGGRNFAPVVMVALFVVGGFLLLPITLLIAAAAAMFGPVVGPLTAMIGALLSASSLFWVGRRMGRRFIRQVAGRALNRVSRTVAKRGVIAVAIVRMVPIAPFSIVNLIAGASHVRYSDFLLGSLIGLTPGVVLYSLVGSVVVNVLRQPTAEGVLMLLGLFVIVLSVSWTANRLLHRYSDHKARA